MLWSGSYSSLTPQGNVFLGEVGIMEALARVLGSCTTARQPGLVNQQSEEDQKAVGNTERGRITVERRKSRIGRPAMIIKVNMYGVLRTYQAAAPPRLTGRHHPGSRDPDPHPLRRKGDLMSPGQIFVTLALEEARPGAAALARELG